MILRAASEGVVGVDTEGRVVLVNPAAAQILGYRASDLGGAGAAPAGAALAARRQPVPVRGDPAQRHPQVRPQAPGARGQVLWAKDGQPVPVDLTTAPVRDGDQLVGAVVTFTDRRALRVAGGQARAAAGRAPGVAARAAGPAARRTERTLAADPAGQLWPEANQILHHLAAGYARMTTLVDNVLGYQRLDAGSEKLRLEKISLDGVVAAGVEGAVELIGPGRAQFAVHAPPIEAEVDGERLATALAHLIADVAGVDATGNAPAAPAGQDSTIVVAAAQRGDVVRIEVRGPYSGGNPVHEPIVRGIVQRHGGVLQTHEVPGAGGNAYVLEVPVSASVAGSAAEAAAGPAESHGGAGSPNGAAPRVRESRENNETTVMPAPAEPVRGSNGQGGAGAGAWTGTQQQQQRSRNRRSRPAVAVAAPAPPKRSSNSRRAALLQCRSRRVLRDLRDARSHRRVRTARGTRPPRTRQRRRPREQAAVRDVPHRDSPLRRRERTRTVQVPSALRELRNRIPNKPPGTAPSSSPSPRPYRSRSSRHSRSPKSRS